jgi:hypothetical protein
MVFRLNLPPALQTKLIFGLSNAHNFPAMSSGNSTKSMQPVSMALSGMSGWLAVISSTGRLVKRGNTSCSWVGTWVRWLTITIATFWKGWSM